MSKDESYEANPSELDGCPDMSSLIYLEEANVMYNLEIRFKRQTVYTAISKILISINPYEWLPLYTDEAIKKYEINSMLDVPDSEVEPHCYNTASIAYNDMNSENKSQSLIVCGESGSGKTESAKALMTFLAKTKSDENSDINLADAVLAVNPILEAFGNAKTVMNNNSSRFGKFTKMIFTDYDKENKDATSRLVGSVINSYLLEKSRVVMQSQGERNFHIFFQIFAGCHSDPKFGLENLADFYYLAQNEKAIEFHVVKGQDDLANFNELKTALKKINIDEKTTEEIFETTTSILHLGNIEFEMVDDKIALTEKSQQYFEKVAELLNLDTNSLLKKLTEKKFTIMKEVVLSPYSLEEAIDNRNSMSKSLYEQIFKWIIQKCNEELLLVKDFKKLRFIGILDVFGFECFERNSFEQFCINFANERLQQLFSESLMLTEQKEYLKEGISWIPLKIPDNRSIMKLVNSKPNGIFSQLEAACNMPKGKPEIFVNNVFKNNKTNKRLSKVKPTKEILKTLKKDEKFNGFKIRHYADSVIYNCNEFLIKNTDRVSSEIFELFSSSDKNVMKLLFPKTDEKSKKKRGSTMSNIGLLFTSELDGLIKTLKTTSNFFVRCVNPNKNKSSKEFDEGHVKKQLRSGGLVQVLKVIKFGYPTRSKYETLDSYKEKITQHPLLEGLSKNDYWSAIMAAFNINRENYQFGLTKVFFKANINFISKIKNFDGSLTPEMIDKIRKMLVDSRLKIFKGMSLTYVRVKNMIIGNQILNEAGKISLLLSAFKMAVNDVREKIRLEKIEEEKERQRQEALRLEQEKRERELEEERARAEEEARLKEEEIAKEKTRLLEEQNRAEEERKNRLEEMKRKEIEMQEKEKQKMIEIEKARQAKLEASKLEFEKKREEEYEKIEQQKRKYEEQHEENKKIKVEEINKLEERIESLKAEAMLLLQQTQEAKEKQIHQKENFEKELRQKIDKEREAAQLRILEETKEKEEEISDKLDEYEKEKRAKIKLILKENEEIMNKKKEEIDQYEKEKKENIKKFEEESKEKIDEMHRISNESQMKMKEYIDGKILLLEQKEKELEEKKALQEKELEERKYQISFEEEKAKNDLEHMKEMAQNEIDYKQKDLDNKIEENLKIEKMYNEKMEDLQKRSKSVSSKEAKARKKSGRNKKSKKEQNANYSKVNDALNGLAEKLRLSSKIFSENNGKDSLLYSYKLNTKKSHYSQRIGGSFDNLKNWKKKITEIDSKNENFLKIKKLFNEKKVDVDLKDEKKLFSEISAFEELLTKCISLGE